VAEAAVILMEKVLFLRLAALAARLGMVMAATEEMAETHIHQRLTAVAPLTLEMLELMHLTRAKAAAAVAEQALPYLR
jgi:hypothetical protein